MLSIKDGEHVYVFVAQTENKNMELVILKSLLDCLTQLRGVRKKVSFREERLLSRLMKETQVYRNKYHKKSKK